MQNEAASRLDRAAKMYRLCPPGRAGHLKDILVDGGDWCVKSFVVDTGIWLPGKRSLVAPEDVEGLDWIERALELRIPVLAPP